MPSNMLATISLRNLTNGLLFSSNASRFVVRTQPKAQTFRLSHTLRASAHRTKTGRRPLFRQHEPDSELVDLNKLIPPKPRHTKKEAVKEESKTKPKKKLEKKKTTPDDIKLVPIRVDEIAKKQAKRVEGLGEDVSNRRKLRLIKPPVQLVEYIDKLNLGLVKTGRFSKISSKFESESRVMMPVLQFFAGAKDTASFPPETLPEVAFVGRSNVGKSSLINVLADSTVVRVSSKPGLTQQINFFTAGDDFHIVDMPGYGFAYAKEEMRESWKNLIETYISKRRTMKRLYILVDARHGVKYIDKQFMQMVDSKNVKFQVVMTKCDLVPRPVLARRYCVVLKDLAEYRHSIKSILMASSHTKAGINNMRKSILHVIGAPIKLLPPSGKMRSTKPSTKNVSKSKRT